MRMNLNLIAKFYLNESDIKLVTFPVDLQTNFRNRYEWYGCPKIEMLITFKIQVYMAIRPPLWSSGQSSWLQIRRPGFDSRHCQKKQIVGLEQGPLSLVSTTEELLDSKVAAPV
jgi:hypothetical protein